VTIPEGERDPNLASDLAAEASGLLNWALEGHRVWKANGLKPPAEVTEATGSYRQDNDLVGQFIDDRCVRQPTAKCTSKVLYEGYVQWCDANGQTPMTINMFGKELKKKKFNSIKGRIGNGWTGIDLKPAFQKTNDGENLLSSAFPSHDQKQQLARFNRIE